MRTENSIRVAVIGVGAFGRNHARVYHELAEEDAGAVEFVGIVDSDLARATNIANEFGAKAFASLSELLNSAKPNAVSVAVPTVAHLEIGRALMQAGVDVLIEKPLAANLVEADELIRLAKQNNRIAQVGQLERFNPAVRATIPLLKKPMFFEVHRLSIFTPRSLDVDVVLDLMIHDLDIVLWFMQSRPTPKAPIGTGVSPAYRNGKPLIRDLRAVGIPILSPKVDIANVRVEFSSGCVANFTASRVSTERVRKLRFFQPRQYVSLDYGRRDVFSLSVQPADPKANDVARSVPGFDIALPSGMALVPWRPKVEDEEPLRAELRAFLAAVRSRSGPPITLQDGRAALALALEILAQIGQHAKRAGL